jgi:glycosyltransferase involved in cell wall biosynthesis
MAADSIALCIPAYNAESHLPRLLASVRAQTVPFEEVWVYDDASTDRTPEIARDFGANVIRGSANVGCSAGKNALLRQVTSPWIHFHDADDVISPEFVARAKARARERTFDALLFDYEQVDEMSGTLMSQSCFAESTLLHDPIAYMILNTVNNGGIYATEFLRRAGGFEEDVAVQYNEDRAFHLKLADAGARFAIEPYVGSRFYHRPQSMSDANKVKCLLSNQEITRRSALKHGGRHGQEVAISSWRNAAGLAAHLEWRAARECVALAQKSAGRLPRESGPLFAALCFVSGNLAIIVREWLIRLVKPQFRSGYPGWLPPWAARCTRD